MSHFPSFASGNFTNSTFGSAQWDAVNEFVESVGWEFIFGLNSLLRSPYPVGVWDSTNAAELMAYSNSKNYTVNWELGNGETSYSSCTLQTLSSYPCITGSLVPSEQSA